MIDVRARLSTDEVAARLPRLGFRSDDAKALTKVVDRIRESPSELAHVASMAQRLVSAIGDFSREGEDPWGGESMQSQRFGPGVEPMLALLITVDEVREFHRAHGVPDDISWKTLSDLGQQVWVHRLTYGSFGLHTHPWLRVAWSGALYWLGRLQFNLQQVSDEWVLSTHIPQVGPLTPGSVDAAFAKAARFFGRHFPEHAVARFYCSSWLLDPQLGEVLDPESNLVQFMRRWDLVGEPTPGDQDVFFFVFQRRGEVDLDSLPADTTLRRAIIERLQAGGHWSLRQGYVKEMP